MRSAIHAVYILIALKHALTVCSQTLVDIHGSHVALLLSDGEGLRGDVPDDPGIPAVGSAREH